MSEFLIIPILKGCGALHCSAVLCCAVLCNVMSDMTLCVDCEYKWSGEERRGKEWRREDRSGVERSGKRG